MRVGIVGAGGVGGLIGGFLGKHGIDVALLARGAHAEAMRARGLRFEGTLGEFTVENLAISDRGSDLGKCDVVFVSVKTWQLESAIPHLRDMVDQSTVVVPLQNGIGVWDLLASEVGERNVVGGLIFVNSWVESPGVIKQVGPFVRVVMGERSGGVSPRLTAIKDLLTLAGITGELDENVLELCWEKFLGFEPMALVGALSRSSIGTFRADPGTRAVLIGLMEEVASIGRRMGVALSDDVIERRMKIIDSLALDATISMQRDLVSARPSEFMEHVVGLQALAKSLGIDTPIHEVCVPLLLLQEKAARRS